MDNLPIKDSRQGILEKSEPLYLKIAKMDSHTDEVN
jgi:hypothetical protein